jgi:hypothetical protein
MNKYATQGRLLIAQLQQRPHTYMDMLEHGVSTSPWRRIAESLRDDQKLVKSKNRRGLTTWRVVKA